MQISTDSAKRTSLGTPTSAFRGAINPASRQSVSLRNAARGTGAPSFSGFRLADGSETPAVLAAQQALRAQQNPTPEPVNPAGITVSPITLDNPTLLRGIGRGTLKITIPMKAGAHVGATTVRPDSHWVVYLSIHNGNVVEDETRIAFEKSDGSAQTLDGFGPFDMKDIYIGDDGKLYANVRCFPDKEITELIFGKGVKKVPTDAGEFINKLSSSTGVAQSPARINGAHFDVTMTADGPRFEGRRIKLPDPPSAADELDDALMLEELNLELIKAPDGTEPRLREGWLPLDDHTAIRFGKNNRITKFGGSFARMKVGVQGEVHALRASGEGTLVQSAGGEIDLDLDLITGTDGAGNPKDLPQTVRATVRAARLEHLKINTRTENGPQLLEIGEIDATPDLGDAIVLHYRSGGGGTKPALLVDVSNLEVNNVGGNLTLRNSKGEPQPFALGDSASGAGSAIIERLRLDTQGQRLDLTARVQVDTKLPHLGLDQPGLAANLDGGRLRGMAKVDFYGGTLRVQAPEGVPMTVSVDGDVDAKSNTAGAAIEGGAVARIRSVTVRGDGSWAFDADSHVTASGTVKVDLEVNGTASGVPAQVVDLIDRLDTGELDVGIPMDPFRFAQPIHARLGNSIRVEVATKPGTERPMIAGSLAVAGGQLVSKDSYLKFEPPLRLRLDVGKPESDDEESFAEASIRGVSIKTLEDGTFQFWPEYDAAGGLDDVLDGADGFTRLLDRIWPGELTKPSAALQESLARSITEAVLGAPSVKMDVPSVAAAVANSARNIPSGDEDFKEVMEKIRLDQAVLRVDDVSLTPGELDLGVGSVNLRAGTTLSGNLVGANAALVLNAKLGATKLETDAAMLRMESGTAQIDIKAARNLLESPVSVVVRDLDAQGVDIDAVTQGQPLRLRNTSVRGARIEGTLKPNGEVTFKVDAEARGAVAKGEDVRANVSHRLRADDAA